MYSWAAICSFSQQGCGQRAKGGADVMHPHPFTCVQALEGFRLPTSVTVMMKWTVAWLKAHKSWSEASFAMRFYQWKSAVCRSQVIQQRPLYASPSLETVDILALLWVWIFLASLSRSLKSSICPLPGPSVESIACRAFIKYTTLINSFQFPMFWHCRACKTETL